ncbi:MAG: hypothetical protein ACJAZO_001278 [Myxococcota bacterium]|jgi:hypothetical protein
MRWFWLPCAAVVFFSSLACSLGDSSPEVIEPVLGAEDSEFGAATEVAVDESSCCCAYIQETSQEKTYDSMLSRNCTEWGFECVDDGFCDGTMAAVEPEPAVAPAPTPVPTPAPAVATPRPAPAPASSSMTRPGSGTVRPSGTTRPSSGGMTRPGSGSTTRPSTRPAPSPSPRPSGGGMTRPR